METIVETLCSNMLSDKEQLRDISSIGLKTVISELPSASTALAASICKKITGRLTSAIAKVTGSQGQPASQGVLGGNNTRDDYTQRFMHNKAVRGYIGFTPSVHLSRIPCPFCSAYSSGLDPFHIHLINQLQKVCHM